MICPNCSKNVKPDNFYLWPGAPVIRVCPHCRIGIGNLGKVMAAGEKTRQVQVEGKCKKKKSS